MSVNFPEKILTFIVQNDYVLVLVKLSSYFPGHKKSWIGRACVGELDAYRFSFTKQ